MNTELLGEGFETNCYEYDLGYKFANYNMRSDCITTCVRSLFNELNNFENCRYTNTPLRFELLEQEQNITFKCDLEPIIGGFYQNIFNIFPELEQRCNKICRMDCNFRYYVLEQKLILRVSPRIV